MISKHLLNKRLFFVLLSLFLHIGIKAEESFVLSVNDTTTLRFDNKKVVVPLYIKTEIDNITSFQFEVEAPDGIRVYPSIETNGSVLSDTHSCSYYLNGNKTSIIGYSSNNTPFTKKEGLLLYLNINCGTVASGNYTINISNCYLSDSNRPSKRYENSTSYTIQLGLYDGVPVKSISLKSSECMLVGEQQQVSANFTPSNATIKDLEWSVDNDEFAVIDGNGLLTAKKRGTVVVNAKAKDGTSITSTRTIIITEKIDFADPATEEFCINKFKSAISGCFTLYDAQNVTDKNLKSGNRSVFDRCSLEYFDEFKYFTSITELPTFYSSKKLKYLSLPEGVKTITANIFDGCTSLSRITISSTIDNIESTFSQSPSLVAIDVVPDNPVYSSENGVLYNKRRNTIVRCPPGYPDGFVIPSTVDTIGDYAFYKCKDLINIELPLNVKILSKYAFASTGLTDIILNNGLHSIEPNAFAYCDSLRRIRIPASVKSLGKTAFLGCLSLKSVILESRVDTIRSYTFSVCASLEEIDIPSSVLTIEENAFYNCNNLKTVISRSATPANAAKAFENLDLSNAVLYVPNGCVEEYRSSLGWNQFGTITDREPGVYEIIFMLGNDIVDKKYYKEGDTVVYPEIPDIEGYTFTGWDTELKTMPRYDVVTSGFLKPNSYNLIYKIDNEVWATDSIAFGSKIVLRDAPTKEGHTFSGWSEAPATMPTNDVVIEGSFTVNSYSVIYKVDGAEYKVVPTPYGSKIVLIDVPAKEGHTFSGWSEAPATMPANDVVIEGSFTVNSYSVIYKVDGEEYKVVPTPYGSKIVLIDVPAKEGHTFSGWSEAPATMPASDVVIEGNFTVNYYTVTYIVDGEVWATDSLAYGSELVLSDEPTKEGHTFSGWSEAPATMPANDITVEGAFAVNSYIVTYLVDGEEYASYTVEYGAMVPVPEDPVKEGHTFSGWSEAPATMPANDITVEGAFAVNSYTVTYMVDGKEYASYTVEYGAEVPVPEDPVKDGYLFEGWTSIPEAMPAEDIVIEAIFVVDTGIILLSDGKPRDVYSLTGLLLVKQATYKEIMLLPQGTYIIEGKKVYIRH